MPFYLETDVQADLSQLPPILKRFVGDKEFQPELALLKELKGSANGKLVIREGTIPLMLIILLPVFGGWAVCAQDRSFLYIIRKP